MIEVKYKDIGLSKYNEFLNSVIIKESKGIGVHEHHIIPKFMGGKNNIENLIILSYEDHRKAHIILADCFEKSSIEYIKNIQSALCVQRWIDNKDDDLRLRLIEITKARIRTPETIQKWRKSREKTGYHVSEETRLKISKANSGPGNGMYGKTHTEETRKKISKISSVTSKGENNGMYGKKHSVESKQKMSDKLKGTRSGAKHNMYGKHHTEETKEKLRLKLTNRIISEETRQKMSETRKMMTGSRSNQSKKIKCNETNIEFVCLKDAKKYYNITSSELHKKIQAGIFSFIK